MPKRILPPQRVRAQVRNLLNLIIKGTPVNGEKAEAERIKRLIRG